MSKCVHAFSFFTYLTLFSFANETKIKMQQKIPIEQMGIL